jgi:hypothetical protein
MTLRSTGILATVLTLTVAMAMAWPKSKKTITFIEPTIVGGVTLQPGDYTYDWNGAGTEVQVTFSRGDKTIVTVPATLEQVHNQQESVILSEASASGMASLVEIDLKNATLHFAPHDSSGGN